MKFYTDEQYRIISIDTEPPGYFMMHEEPGELSESVFANMCDTCIRMHKHEPQYQQAIDENGELLFDAFLNRVDYVDENGEKVIIGWQTVPYVDYNVIMSIQAEHDAQEKEKTELQLALVEQYETNLTLQEEVTNTQIAIAEFYEAGGAV